jgi:hypothetical protein
MGQAPQSQEVEIMNASSAVLSDCGLYRYRLGRQWSPGPTFVTIMLNPSTADAETDDRTIGRCRFFAMREGFGGLAVVNLCALRATDPSELAIGPDAVGPLNQDHIRDLLSETNGLVLAAWGNNAAKYPWLEDIAREVSAMIGTRAVCLGTTASGHPRHPLYVKGTAPLLPFGFV